MDLTLGSKHYHVSLLVLLAVALGLLWVSTRGSREADASRAAWMATKDKFHASVRVAWSEVALHLHHEARLAQDTTRLRVARDSALAQAIRLAQSVDSLHRAPLTAAVRRVGEACGEQLNTCEQRVGAAWGAFETEHTLRLLATTRVAHADSIIERGLAATQCKFLLVFGCLSRAQAAELGLAGGVILTLLVHH